MCTRVQGGAGTGRCRQAWGTLATLANLEMRLEQSSANTGGRHKNQEASSGDESTNYRLFCLLNYKPA